MNKHLLTISLVVNVILIAALFWSRTDNKNQLQDREKIMMRADEAYIDLLDRSLTAIGSPGSEETATTVEILQKFVSTGKANREARRRMGL